MAATQGETAYGTLIKIGDGASPEVFDTIDEAYSIGPVASSVDLVDFTHHESPSGFAEFKPSGVQEGDEIAVECNNVPGNTSQNLVRTAHADKTTDNWQVILNNGQTFAFAAIVIREETDPGEIRGKQIFRFTIKVTGALTRTDP